MSLSPNFEFRPVLRFPKQAAGEAADVAQPALATTPAVPRIKLHAGKTSKYLDVIFRYSLLICSASIIAVMVLFFL